MDKLKIQVRRAQRRLICEQFLTKLTWCLFAALLAAVVAIAVPKLLVLGVDRVAWAWSWLGGALGAGLVAAIVWTLVLRRSELDAAIELDLRFGLKERVSSSLSLSEDDLQSDAGRALVKDALKRVDRIEVEEKFHVRLDRRAWLPLVPAVVAFFLVVFVDDRGADNTAKATTTSSQQIKKSTEVLRKKIAERRKKAKEKGLKDAEGLFKKLEEGTRELSKKKDIDQKKAMVKLNDLARVLQKRRKQMGDSNQMRKQLNQLKNLSKGPADKLAKAMKKGDFKQALNELKKLEAQLKNGKLSKEDQARLAKQFEQMKDKLQKMADRHRQAMEDLKKQIAKQRDAGNNAEAGKLQQQLDRLAQQMPQMNKLQQLAGKLGQASASMKQGDGKAAAAALGQMVADLEAMQQELDEFAMLADLEDQIAMAKDAMGCKECGGAG